MGTGNMLVVAATIIIMVIMKGIFAANHSLVWSVSDASGYPSWAADHTFLVGDTIEFEFSGSEHTLAMVTSEGYEACDPGNAQIHTTGPTTITLDTPGPYYFICTIGQHCTIGQRLSVNVTVVNVIPDAPAPAPAPAPIALAPIAPETPSASSSPLPLGSTIFSISFAAAFLVALLQYY